MSNIGPRKNGNNANAGGNGPSNGGSFDTGKQPGLSPRGKKKYTEPIQNAHLKREEIFKRNKNDMIEYLQNERADEEL
mgnify:CR=1 FL=1